MAVSSPINTRLAQKPDDSLDPKIRAAIEPLYDAMQAILSAFQSYVGPAQWPFNDWPNLTPDMTVFPQFHRRLYVIAGEAIPAGNIVNLYNNAGVLNARNANATNNTKMAHGFCNTTGGIALGAVGEVIVGSGIIATAGLTPGQQYWLSVVNGLITAVAPVAAGNIEQYVGVALSTTLLLTGISGYIQH